MGEVEIVRTKAENMSHDPIKEPALTHNGGQTLVLWSGTTTNNLYEAWSSPPDTDGSCFLVE